MPLMVSIDVPIYPDRAASIRAGLDPGAASIAVDLGAITQEERDLLADNSGKPVSVTTPTVEDLFEALRAASAEEQATLAEVLDAYRAVLQERRVKTWREQLPSGGATYDVVEPGWPNVGRGIPGRRNWGEVMAKHQDKVRQITHGDEAAAWLRELVTLNTESRERARNEHHDIEEARNQERDHGIARLREWALRNGSERVRLLIEEEMDSWFSVAEEEYFTLHTPEGFTPLADDDYVRSLPTPDAADIHALRDARRIAAAEDALGEPELVWIGKVIGPGQLPGRPAVRLAATGPHGAQRLVWRAVAEDTSPRTTDSEATVDEPHEPSEWPDPDDLPRPTLDEAIDDLRGLIDQLDDVRPDGMTSVFYIHAYNQLIESSRQLLEALEAEPTA